MSDPTIPPPQLLGVIPWLACTDVREMIAFFRDKLGFAEEWTWGEPPTDGGICRGEARLYFVHDPELAARVSRSEISIAVDDVDALYAEHLARGAPIVRPIQDEPWGLREYHVRAPSGYVLRFGGDREAA